MDYNRLKSPVPLLGQICSLLELGIPVTPRLPRADLLMSPEWSGGCKARSGPAPRAMHAGS